MPKCQAYFNKSYYRSTRSEICNYDRPTDRQTNQPTRQMDRRARREVSIPLIFTLFYLLELFLKVAGLAANAVYLYYTGEQWKIGKVNMGSFHKIIKLIL